MTLYNARIKTYFNFYSLIFIAVVNFLEIVHILPKGRIFKTENVSYYFVWARFVNHRSRIIIKKVKCARDLASPEVIGMRAKVH